MLETEPKCSNEKSGVIAKNSEFLHNCAKTPRNTPGLVVSWHHSEILA
jgi:hypothetical protein